MWRMYRKKTLSLVKELDAFPKVPESYVETTVPGGTVSFIAFAAMALLAFCEFFEYRDTWMKYEYKVDQVKLRINIDLTVAMKCQHVGADILDLAETMITSNGIQYEPNRLRKEHSLQECSKGSPYGLASEPVRACRIHGHVYVNKVAGNFHITVGKPLHHPHAHIAAFVSHDMSMFQCVAAYNFSHRIDHLSFGEDIPGIINPLDGTEEWVINQPRQAATVCLGSL